VREKYSLEDLLEAPDRPLTPDEWNNFDRYMRMTNGDKSAADVDIGSATKRIVSRILQRKTCLA